MTKICKGPCKKELPLEAFYKRQYKNGSVGYRSYCTPCNNAYRDEWRHKNKEWDNARNNQYNKRNAMRIRGHKLRKYWPGATWEQANANYDTLLDKQGGTCAVCKRHKRLAVDHCHGKGQVRGLLCGACNRGIGYLQDSVEVISSAVEYLMPHK